MHCYFGKPLYLCNVLRIEVVGNPRGQVTSLNKVLGGLSSFLRNIIFYLHPVPHEGYTMINLGDHCCGIWLNVEWYTPVGRVPIVLKRIKKTLIMRQV